MCQRGWSYIVKAGTIILVCNFIVQLMLTFTFSFKVIDYDGITEEGTQTITEKYLNEYAYKDNNGNYYMQDAEGNLVVIESEEDYNLAISYHNEVIYTVNDHPELDDEWNKVSSELQSAAETSILANIAKPFAYLFAPITGDEHSWQLAAAAITGFIAKENVVGTLAVCYGTPNKINADFELIGNGSETLQAVMGISVVIALAYLMFNLFTPPCFAAIGAMNSEIKDKKWFFGGIAFQFGIGYSLAFLVAFFGNLFTQAAYSSIWMPILGWAVVILFAGILTYLIIKNNSPKEKQA
jgi:Fe2+ transport system protein B